MSFVDGIYRFTLLLNDSNRGVYEELQLRTPKHPYEPIDHLIARVLVFAHSYSSGLEFSEGFFNQQQPAIWKRSIIDELLTWIDVGLPEEKKIKKALRDGRKHTEYRIYFYDQEQIHDMAHQLKGSKTNWIEPISFFAVDPLLIEHLQEHLDIRNDWTFTFIDSTIYVTCEEYDFEGRIHAVNMWDEYQNVIANASYNE